MSALNTCPCCGHSVTRSESRLTVQVDDGLLHLCNQAFAVAQKWGAIEVGVAHMVWCFASASTLSGDLERAGLAPSRLRQEAEKAARGRASAAGAATPRTSAELKTLLARAETLARRNGRTCASDGDLLHVLLNQSIDIGSADFVRLVLVEGQRQSAASAGAMAGERRTAMAVGQSYVADRLPAVRGSAGATGGDRGFTSSRPQDRPGQANTPPRPSQEPPAFGEDARRDLAALSQTLAQDRATSAARLERQAREIAELRRQTEAFEARSEPSRDWPQSQARLEQHERDIGELRRLVRSLDARSSATHDTEIAQARLQHQEREIAELRRLVTAQAERTKAAQLADVPVQRIERHEREIAELNALVRSMAEQARAMMARMADLTTSERELEAALAERDARLVALEQGDETTGGARDRRRNSRRAQSLQRSRLRRLARRMRSRMRQRLQRRERRQTAPWHHQRTSWQTANDTALARLSLPPPALRVAEPLSPYAVPVETEASRHELLVEIEDVQAEELREEEEADETLASGERPKRFYLALDDEIERAPSIGPKTAANLLAANIVRVRDLLACDPQMVASLVPSRYVSAERVAAWKAQARLVCSVPWLRGTHAQMLVGAGFDSLEKLRRADTGAVCARILRYAATREGQSVLRSGPPPEPDRVAGWMANVALAEPERAAASAAASG